MNTGMVLNWMTCPSLGLLVLPTVLTSIVPFAAKFASFLQPGTFAAAEVPGGEAKKGVLWKPASLDTETHLS